MISAACKLPSKIHVSCVSTRSWLTCRCLSGSESELPLSRSYMRETTYKWKTNQHFCEQVLHFLECTNSVMRSMLTKLFYCRVTVPKRQDIPMFTVSVTDAPWEKFGIEFILTFVVVFSYFVSMDSHSKWMGKSALTMGATYSACTFISPVCRNS